MMKDLTEGKPSSVLWRFSLPMFISVIFQQLYSIADSVIAGKFAGENALAAVGASYPITMIFMAIAVGSNIGCSIVISQLFGGKKYKEMKVAISTSLIASASLSVLLTIVGILCSSSMMLMVQTPQNIFADGNLYLQIYIGGFLFLYLYNVATGIFNSLGDSKTPLYFLIGSSLGNIFLDMLFVAVCKWGVAGVAWATFLAQGIACIFVLLTLRRRMRKIQISGTISLFSFQTLKRIAGFAIPSILQQSFISVGNIFIQGLINSCGSSVIAGYSSAIKLNTFAITSFATLANGISSFTAQNVGANKPDRVKAGHRAGTIIGLFVAMIFFLLYFVFSIEMLNLFMDSDSVTALETGKMFLKIVTPFYFVVCLKLTADGVLRGSGAMRYFMITTFSDLILRVVLAFILFPFWNTTGIWLSWPIGWTVAAILSLWFTLKGAWKQMLPNKLG